MSFQILKNKVPEELAFKILEFTGKKSQDYNSDYLTVLDEFETVLDTECDCGDDVNDCICRCYECGKYKSKCRDTCRENILEKGYVNVKKIAMKYGIRHWCN